jgi:hypothetical protein
MTMHDEFAEVLVIPEKFISNPEQIIFPLLEQRYA